jgi:VCBS repeat-containing protein
MKTLLRNIFISTILCVLSFHAYCQGVIREDGTIAAFRAGDFKVDFFGQDKIAGPAFFIQQDSEKKYGSWTLDEHGEFSTRIGDVSACLQYLDTSKNITFTIKLRNEGDGVFAPKKAGVSLGIDTYMEEYPQWLSKFFPTLMMCEKTHFYGYLQSPQGHVLAVTSPDPVASWSVDYNLSYWDIPEFWFYGHRIESVNLDLINALPLPGHHPQDMWKLDPGQEYSWTVSLIPVTSLDNFEKEVFEQSGLPVLKMARTTYAPDEHVVIDVYSADRPQVSILHESGESTATEAKQVSEGLWKVETSMHEPGQYDVTVCSSEYQSSAVLLVNDSWEKVMKDARLAAWENHQKPSSHVESWYGFHSAFLAARHFPDKELDEALDQRFDLIYNKVFD